MSDLDGALDGGDQIAGKDQSQSVTQVAHAQLALRFCALVLCGGTDDFLQLARQSLLLLGGVEGIADDIHQQTVYDLGSHLTCLEAHRDVLPAVPSLETAACDTGNLRNAHREREARHLRSRYRADRAIWKHCPISLCQPVIPVRCISCVKRVSLYLPVSL